MLWDDPAPGFIGIAHTCWVPHGAPTALNARQQACFAGELGAFDDSVVAARCGLMGELAHSAMARD